MRAGKVRSKSSAVGGAHRVSEAKGNALMRDRAVGSDRDIQSGGQRHFLLLQGPCGQFFSELKTSLTAQGHRCTRVAINGGDYVNGVRAGILPFRASFADWPHWLEDFARREGVTDLICYGDCRPYHRAAIQVLKPAGVAVHVLEEGYLRPNWVTCESEGVNGFSALTRIDLGRVDPSALSDPLIRPEVELKGTHWHYILSGFLYYFWTFLLTPAFPRYESHRDIDIVGEAALWLGRYVTMPWRRFKTRKALEAIKNLGRPIHLVLLQLNGDSQIRVHSSFDSTRDFAEFCIAEFAAGASPETILVFKNHPLDNGIIRLEQVIADAARRSGIEDRVFFVETGKLVPLLESAISVTAVNSTACHQALLRSIPTMVLGRAVFNHPQVTAQGRLADFFRLRPMKDRGAYEKLVNLMRATCQFNGGFYSQQGRDALMPGLTRALAEGLPLPQSFELPANVRRGDRRAS